MAAAPGFEQFLGELECPVCLLIPREGPVAMCSVGHIVCKTCKVNTKTCPTCRRPMLKEGTNTVVNKIIEQVPHPCKYKQFGCEVKKRHNDLVDHESRCPERTVKCPYLNCKKEIQIRKYNDHAAAFTSQCNDLSISVSDYSFSDLYARNGENIQDQMTRDVMWAMTGFEGFGTFFYLHQHYFAVEKIFAFYITVPMSSKEAEKYLAKITLQNRNDKRKSLANIQNVISMDSAPRNRKEVLASKNVMFVPWLQMSGFLKWTENKRNQKSEIVTSVDITDESQDFV